MNNIMKLASIGRKAPDISGKTYGRLTATAKVGSVNGNPSYLCKCTCGSELVVRKYSLESGNTKSCGCLKAESQRTARTHGMTHAPEYNAWAKMWARTTNPKDKNYGLYKNRKPPESWRDFEVFCKDVGPKPSPKHSLDRIDNDLPYGPSNCRWATGDVQHNNTSANLLIAYQGETKTAAQWAYVLGIKKQTLYSRIRRGHPIDKLFTTGAINERS